MNNIVFKTSGDWESTTLTNNGTTVATSQLFIELRAGRFPFGSQERGGIKAGGELTGFVRPQYDPREAIGIFPGRLEMQFPGHTITIENTHPMFAFEHTRVWYNGMEVTDRVMDIYVDVNAIDNVVKAYVSLYEPHWIACDESTGMSQFFSAPSGSAHSWGPQGQPGWTPNPFFGTTWGAWNGGWQNRFGGTTPTWFSTSTPTPQGAPFGFPGGFRPEWSQGEFGRNWSGNRGGQWNGWSGSNGWNGGFEGRRDFPFSNMTGFGPYGQSMPGFGSPQGRFAAPNFSSFSYSAEGGTIPTGTRANGSSFSNNESR